MDYKLILELWAWDSNPENPDAVADSVVIVRELSLPFAPAIGMEIQLTPSRSNKSSQQANSEPLVDTDITFVPIFKIERIEFRISIDGNVSAIHLTPSICCDWGEYPTMADRNTIVSQLVNRYGFVTMTE
jgi:hypothetical protein